MNDDVEVAEIVAAGGVCCRERCIVDVDVDSGDSSCVDVDVNTFTDGRGGKGKELRSVESHRNCI